MASFSRRSLASRFQPWVLAGLTGSAWILGIGCTGGDGGPAPVEVGPEVAQLAIEVETAKASSGSVELQGAATGVVEAWQRANMRAETGGRVRSVGADNGEYVESGRTLVRIDGSRQSIAVSGAQAQVEGLEQDLEFARSDLERKRKLAERGSAANVTVDAAEHTVARAESALAAAQANLRGARRQVADTRIDAPFAGVVVNRMIDPGDTTAPGAPLLELVDLSRVRVRVGVAGSELASIEVGMTAKVRIEDLGGLELAAVVGSISPVSNPMTGLFDIELQADNVGEPGLWRVRAGMVASARFEGRSRTPRVLVPRAAVTRRAGRVVVFEIVEGSARERVVRIGASGATSTEILEGLEVGAVVATSALHSLAEGVAVIPEPAEGAPELAADLSQPREE